MPFSDRFFLYCDKIPHQTSEDNNMKMYSWNNQKISINYKGRIKTISPFFLVSDEMEHLFANNSYTLLDNLFNVEEMKNISKNIESIIADIKDELLEKTNTLTECEERLKNTYIIIKSMEEKIKQQETIIQKYEKILETNTLEYNSIQEKNHSILNQLKRIQYDADEKIKNAEYKLNNIKVQLEDTAQQAETKTAAKYVTINLNMENTYNKFTQELIKYVNKSKEYAELSRKWASEPLNMPVEEGLYSSRHYALILKNREASNE